MPPRASPAVPEESRAPHWAVADSQRASCRTGMSASAPTARSGAVAPIGAACDSARLIASASTRVRTNPPPALLLAAGLYQSISNGDQPERLPRTLYQHVVRPFSVSSRILSPLRTIY